MIIATMIMVATSGDVRSSFYSATQLGTATRYGAFHLIAERARRNRRREMEFFRPDTRAPRGGGEQTKVVSLSFLACDMYRCRGGTPTRM